MKSNKITTIFEKYASMSNQSSSKDKTLHLQGLLLFSSGYFSFIKVLFEIYLYSSIHNSNFLLLDNLEYEVLLASITLSLENDGL